MSEQQPQDDALYLSMLEQMGLQRGQVPADMRATIYQKLGLKTPGELSKQKREKQQLASKQQSQLANQDENEVNNAIGGSEKLTLAEVFQSLESGNQVQASGLNTTKVKSQLKKLSKNSEGAMKLEQQISGRKRVRQQQEANYEINKQNLKKYLNQVKKAREEVQTDFTTSDKILHGGGV